MIKTEHPAIDTTVTATHAHLQSLGTHSQIDVPEKLEALCIAPEHPNGYFAHVMMGLRTVQYGELAVLATITFIPTKKRGLQPSWIELQISGEEWGWAHVNCTLKPNGTVRLEGGGNTND